MLLESLFQNDDGCGDWLSEWGEKRQFVMQFANTVSSLFFLLSGVEILMNASSPRARAYGVGNWFIALGAACFHSTNTVMGFLADIVAIASCSTLLVSGGVCAIFVGPQSELVQLVLPMVTAFGALLVPSVMLMAGLPHTDVWGAWGGLLALIVIALCIIVAALNINRPVNVIVFALCWVVMYVPWVMALSGFPSSPYVLYFVADTGIAACSGLLLSLTYTGMLLWAFTKWTGAVSTYVNLLLSLTCILLGLGCTVHSFVPGMCNGVRQNFPFHAGWHLFSSITLNRAGHLLDVLVNVPDTIKSKTNGQRSHQE